MDKGSSWMTFMPQTLLVASCTMGLVLTVGILGGVAWFDKVLYDNPDLRKELEDQQLAYLESLTANLRENAWGSTAESVNNPKAYLMSMFIGKSPELRRRLSRILDAIPEEKILFLVRLFKSIELSDGQINRFVALVEKILQGERAADKFRGMIEFAEGAVRKKLQDKKEQSDDQQDTLEGDLLTGDPSDKTDPEIKAEDLLTEDTELDQSDFKGAIDLLTSDDPDEIDELLALIAELPPELGARVSDLIGSLAATDSDKLLAILELFNRSGIKAVVNLLSKISDKSTKKLVDRYSDASKGQIKTATKILNALPPPTTDKLITVTSSLSNRTFFTAVDLVGRLDNRSINTFIGIGSKVGGKKFGDVIELLDDVKGNTQKSALELMDNISTSHISTLLTVTKKLNGSEIRKGIDILYDVRSSTLQQNALEIFDNLNSKNLKNAIDVMDDISNTGVKKSITLAHDFESDIQNQVFDQFSRVVTKSGSLSTGTAQPNTIYGNQQTRVKPKRIELLIDKLLDLNNVQTAQDIIAAGEGMNDKSLNQAADVFIDLDTTDSGRTNRLVRVYKRSSNADREAIVDTLDDISVRHVSAAVDIVDRVEDNLLSESLQVTKNLKKDLGRKEGLDATMRLITVASKNNNQEDLLRGVAVVKKQNSVTMRKVLKQISSSEQTFTPSTLNKMTALHESLDSTKAKKLTNIIAGDEGFTIGAKVGGGGASRQVTKARRDLRIREYFDDNNTDNDKKQRKLDFITSRPIIVPTNKERRLVIKTPTTVAGVRGKTEATIVQSSKPTASKPSFSIRSATSE